MDIVNKSLPRGSKFYPVDEVLKVPLSSLMDRNNIETIRAASEVINESRANNEYWQMWHNTHNWELPEGTDQYPIIRMPSTGLRNITHQFGIYADARKSNYLGSSRIGYIKAVASKHMDVQYDPLRGGVWLHDVEYEGELLSNRPMVINKNLKSAIKTKIGELALEALIGAGEEDLKVGYSYYQTKAARAEQAAELIEKILSGDYDTTDLAECAVCLGLYNPKYSNTIHAHVIDLDSPGTADFDITPSARTKLIYLFGGYKLPDDYQDWFDKQ